MLRSFFNDQKIKDKYVARIKRHRELDNLTQGIGWEDGKGCAVGCTLENYNHAQYEVELGLPEWLARLEDTIFEGLPKERAMSWPQEFLEAIPVGSDLSLVKHKFLIFILNECLTQFDNEKFKDVAEAIKQSRALHESVLAGNTWDESAAASAWRAAASAWSAAWSAGSAAASAAARAAESAAARAAASAAASAWSAAWSAGSAAYIKYADKLLELLKAEVEKGENKKTVV